MAVEIPLTAHFSDVAIWQWNMLWPIHGVQTKYRQNGVDIEINALKGLHRSFQTDLGGATVMTFDDDFIFKKQDLPFTPRIGDEIRVVDRAAGLINVYRVGIAAGSNRPWRWSDSFHRTMRVHSTAVGEEEIDQVVALTRSGNTLTRNGATLIRVFSIDGVPPETNRR